MTPVRRWCSSRERELAAAGEPAVRINLVAALVYLVAMINAANRLGVILRLKGGAYEAGTSGSAAN